MGFIHKHYIHLFFFALFLVSLLSFYSCEKNNQLVNPFETAKIEIKLVLPEGSQQSIYEYQGKDSNHSVQNGQALNINDVQVSVLDSATQSVIIKKQQLTISGNSATGELNIPVTGARQTFIIIVFASDPVQLLFFVGSENIQLESGEERQAPVIIILGEPVLIASHGSPQVSSSFSEVNFAPELALDFDFSTSWFSAGSSVDGGTSTFTWTSAQDDFIASAGIVNNAENKSILLRSGYGFKTVTFQVFSGPNATGNLLFEETVDYPKSDPLPIATVAPLVTGRSIRLLLIEPENPARGGFSELLIVGMNFASDETPTLVSILVAPADTSIIVGETQQFKARGTFSDNSTSDITDEVTWSSNDTDVATISSAGLATADSSGNTTITASLSGVSGQTGLSVTAATLRSILVTPANPAIKVGETQQFTATGTYSDNSTSDITNQVTWSSSNTDVATISSSGLATAHSVGNTTIKAELSGVSGQTGLSVTAATLSSILVTPANPAIKVGETQQFTATGTFSDNSTSDITNQVTWSSDKTDVATISSTGLATANSVGNTTIKAELSGVSGQTGLSVTAATLSSILVIPEDPAIKVGETQQFTATGNFSDNSTSDITDEVTWSSNNTDVATISSTGLATAHSVGNTTISAEKDAISGNTTLNVSELTGAKISNFGSELIQANDSTSCDVFNGPIGSLFDFSLQYNDANGNVSVGTIAQVAWESQPSKLTGTFDINSPTITGDAFTGTINFLTCWIFGGEASFDVTVTITDEAGGTSNSLTINIPKPRGANSQISGNIKTISRKQSLPQAGPCSER